MFEFAVVSVYIKDRPQCFGILCLILPIEKSFIPHITDLLNNEWKKCESMPTQWKLKDKKLKNEDVPPGWKTKDEWKENKKMPPGWKFKEEWEKNKEVRPE